MIKENFSYMTARESSAAMAAGKVSSVELTNAAIARIEEHDAKINAVCAPDFEWALSAAKEADTARSRGIVGPLLGVPMTVKESFNVAGLPTTWGIPPFRNFKVKEDAVAVARMRKAGAIILGKTNVPFGLADLQSYNDIYGTTTNPWNPERTPGGSSGGSAAALAAGYGAVSIGSDIAGSLRVPAHCCGVYAHKPTFGLLPVRGHTPPANRPLAYDRDLTVVGPMARSATDLALMLDILADPDDATVGNIYRLRMPAARHRDLASYRVLVVETHPLIPTASNVRAAIDRLVDQIAKVGVSVSRQSPLLPDLVEAARLYMRLLMSSLSASYPAEVYESMRAEAARLDPSDLSLCAERLRGNVLNHRDWLIADATRAQHRQTWRELFAEFDIVICPVMPTPALPHDHSPNQWTRSIIIDGSDHNYGDQLVWAGLATAPGLPATAVPIGFSEDGLPIGLQLVGPMYEDRTTIRFAELLEREFGGFVVPPLDS